MSLDDKVRLVPNGRKLISGETDIDIDDAVALSAGEMVMMLASTADTVVMCPVCKLHTIQQTHRNQLLYGAIDRSSTQARLYFPHLLPEIINREIGTANSKFYQSICDKLSRARMPLTHLVEGRAYFVCYNICRSVFLSALFIVHKMCLSTPSFLH